MKTSLKTSQFWNTMALATAMFAASPSLAQVRAVSAEGSGHSGGGNVTESDFRSYMAKLDTYLMSVEGKTTFPEIVAYDTAHPSENFHQLILSTQPTVKSMDLVDQFGESRDCMSYAQPGLRYFVCDSRKLPEKTLANQPSFYRIILHELFVQAGIEKPMSKAVPSDYSVSYRITQNVHLETYQEWVPGKKANESDLVPYLGRSFMQCVVPELNLYFDSRPNYHEDSYHFYEKDLSGSYSRFETEVSEKSHDNGVYAYAGKTNSSSGVRKFAFKTYTSDAYTENYCTTWTKGNFQIETPSPVGAASKIQVYTAYCSLPFVKGLRFFSDHSWLVEGNCDEREQYRSIVDGKLDGIVKRYNQVVRKTKKLEQD